MNTTTYTEEVVHIRAVKGTTTYKKIKWSIFLVGVSVFAQLYNFQPILSEITQYFKVTPSESSYLVSASTLGMAIGLLLFAFIADSYPRKDIMLFSLVTSTMLTLLSVWASDFSILVNINFIKGMCISGVSAVTLAYLAEEIDPKYIGTAISFYLAGNTFGGMFGRIVAALVSGWLGWQAAVFTIGILAVVIAVAFYILFPESRFFTPKKLKIKHKLRQMKSIFRNYKILAMYLVAICLMGAFVSVYNFLGFKLESAPYNLPHYLIAMIFLMYAFGIFGNMVAGSLSDRYSPRKILLIALGLMLIGVIGMYMDNLVIILLGLTFFTISFFSGHTVASRVVTTLGKEAKSSATALYWFFYYIGSSIIGSSTGVFVNKGNWNGFFYTLIGMTIIALLATYLSTRQTKKATE
ncbi:MFS transporter [Myroides odoratimimus]|uniref:MFS transporter n=1 Tax=Myroides odoratimimus TaxID=76832 RepID=A0AAI8G598_9FLAO|nr:MFS transporter [Myroides odoratimimus]ALU26795.1 MFS transporter [Myroides odoratimimus]MCA4793310.1 MFS transporter [Myroides odoratimimus]MCA4807207.1 MFS transporter [Myroides odoratimimus]MCA4820571.1 MFS transporter [Myroides odoratimimus]MCO7723492.1 MFS transporter [Myroides odoratimimus]